MGSDLAKARTQQTQLEDRIEQLQLQNEQLKKVKANAKPKVVKEPTKKTTKPQAAIQSIPVGKEQIANHIKAVFRSDYAVSVAVCESGLNPYAVGGHGERGIYQIHPVHINSIQQAGYSWDQMFDYKANIAYAKMLYGWQGWSPWTCARMI